jgi:hypothetical protein
MTPTTPTTEELEILKTDVLGRVRMPKAKRELILDRFEGSGMSGQAFADYIGVKYTTFASWVQNRRRERGEYGEGRRSPAPLALVEAVMEPAGTGDRCSGLKIETRGGHRVEVSGREQIGLAVELIRALER